jgi:gliding motility-associated-like protein
MQVPGNGQVTVTTSSGTLTDCVMAVYTGPNAANLTLVGCDDDSGPGSMPQLSVAGQVPGSTIWVRVWDYGSNATGTFDICAQTSIPTAQDCLGALPICQAVYSTTQSYTNTGNILNEINKTTSCLGDGEKNDVWYTFSVQRSGDLAFNITPFNSGDDYDWAVFDLTSDNCQDIFSTPGMQVSCNFSSTPGVTGTNNTSSATSQGAFGSKFNAKIPVVKDQVYVINISNYSSTQSGYTIDFSPSTADIYDTVKPRLKVIDVLPGNCGSSISFTMTENVTCATTSAADFQITGPTGIVHTGTAISSLNCSVGAGYDNSYTLTFAPPLTESGIFTLSLTSTAGNVTDLCGNVSNPNSPGLIFQADTPQVSISAQAVSCKGFADGSATVSVVNPVVAPTYLWSNNAATASITGLAAGTYTVTVTVGLCTKVLSATVTEPANGLTTSITTVVETCGQGNGSATVTVSNNTGAVAYTWSDAQGTATATGLTAGTYYVTVKDANSCTAKDTAVVGLSNSSFTIFTKGDTSCAGGSGTAYAVVTGGTLPYTYLWSNNSGNDSIINVANGSYTLTVTDNIGCSATASTGILRNPLIQLNPSSSTTATCGVANGSATVNPAAGGGGFTYVWSNAQTTKTADNLTPGVFYVTVTDANACTTKDSVTVPQSGGPSITGFFSSLPLCYAGATGSATVNAAGNAPLTYKWANGQQAAAATGLAAGNYTVTVTDINGCTAAGNTTVAQPDSISIAFISLADVTCFGGSNGSISISATGGTGALGYAWSNNQSTAGATGLTAGAYTVMVKDANNCTAGRVYAIAQPAQVVAAAGNDTTIAAGASAPLGRPPVAAGGTAPYAFAWSPAAFLDAANIAAPVATPPATAVYCLTVTDANGCTGSDCITVAVAQYPIADAGADTGICKGSTVAIGGLPTASGGTAGYAYNWQPAQLLAGSTLANPTTLPLTATTAFTVIITDNFGLKDTDVVVVNILPGIIIAAQPSDALCFGEASGQVVASATGGNGALTYAWSTGPATATLPAVGAGTYLLTVTDASFCTATATVTVGQPAQLVADTASIAAFCFGQPSGSATVIVSGGIQGYTYLWGSGQTTATVSSLGAGTYPVTVTDANACTATAIAHVGEANRLQLSSAVSPLTCTYTMNGKISLSATGGVVPYQYEVFKPAQPIITTVSGDFNALDSGFYYIRVRDNNNCFTADSVFVKPAVPDEIVLETTPASCYGLEYKDGVIIIRAVTIDNGPYSYWLNDTVKSTSGEFNGLGFGKYNVSAINAAGCRVDTVAVVDRPAPLVVSIQPDTVTLPLGGSATLQVIDNANRTVAYQWSPAEGLSCSDCPSPVVTVYNEKEFTVRVSDFIPGGAVCSAGASILIRVEKPLPAFIPNMFSPNGDGDNDVFRIYGNNIREVSFRVFNRWGELVYQSANINEGWNGDFKGGKQSPGVYVYIADITFLDNSKVFRQGSVTLTR